MHFQVKDANFTDKKFKFANKIVRRLKSILTLGLRFVQLDLHTLILLVN